MYVFVSRHDTLAGWSSANNNNFEVFLDLVWARTMIYNLPRIMSFWSLAKWFANDMTRDRVPHENHSGMNPLVTKQNKWRYFVHDDFAISVNADKLQLTCKPTSLLLLKK